MSLDAICWLSPVETMTNSSEQTQINLKSLFHVDFLMFLFCCALLKANDARSRVSVLGTINFRAELGKRAAKTI